MTLNNLSLSHLPVKANDRRCWGELSGAGLALELSSIVKRHPGFVVVLVPDMLVASKLERELTFFLGSTEQLGGQEQENGHENPLLTFPDWETLPYDTFSPHQDIISERLTTLYRLPDLKRGVLVVPATTLMHRLCPKDYLGQNTLLLNVGDTLDMETMRTRLLKSGYRCTPQVMEHGEFAIRGSLLDLFPMGSECPFRIDLFGNTIDSIRLFDPDTQRSLEKVQEIRLLPAREYPLTDEVITAFRTRWRQQFEGDPRQSSVYLDVSQGIAAMGLEYYLPLFFEETHTLFDYIPDNCLMVKLGGVDLALNEFWQQVKDRFDQYGHDRQRPILEPKNIFIEPDHIFRELKRFPQIQLTIEKVEDRPGYVNCGFHPLPELSVESRHASPLARLQTWMDAFPGRILFCAESAGRREVLRELLSTHHLHAVETSSWSAFLESDIKRAMVIAPLEEGMLTERLLGTSKQGIAVITESELLGKRVMQRRRRKTRVQEPELAVRSLAELAIDDPVVHLDYGIGRYLGLTYLTLSGQEGEFVTLEYAGGDKLYVPVASLHLISRYSSV